MSLAGAAPGVGAAGSWPPAAEAAAERTRQPRASRRSQGSVSSVPPAVERFTLRRNFRSRQRLTSSTARYPLCVYIDGIDRLARGHDQSVPLAPAKAQIGAAFGRSDMPDIRGVGAEDGAPFEPRVIPPSAPQF